MVKVKLCIALCLLVVTLPWFAQNTALSTAMPDSLFPAIPDSLKVSSPKLDSLFYTADSIYYQYDLEQIRLYGNPKLNYQDAEISSDSLLIDLKHDRAYSYGPTRMRDGDQLLLGSNVRYDVATQTGMLDEGLSLMEKGYYRGKEIRKISGDIYDIDEGTFTNCDLEEPSFWFWSKQLRVYRGDKIVGKPVITYVNHFPVFYFPFISVPLNRGRKPGFLIPEPGYNRYDGKYLRNIAWYYPYKDFADLILSMELREKTGWKANLRSNYIQRYIYNGGVDASFQKTIGEGTQTYDWALQGNHHHELPNKASFDANLNFISNKRIWQVSDDIDQSLAQRLTSSISYRQSLGSSYLNAGSIFTQDLINDRASINLPSASFSLAQRPVSELFSADSDSWLSNLSYRYSVYLDHTGDIRKKRYDLADLIWDNSIDPADSTGGTFLNEHHAGIKHFAGLAYNWKYKGWLNLREGIDYSESWMDRDKNGAKPARGYDYSAYVGSNFNIYGMRNFSKGMIKSIRHIASPSVSLSYQPDSSYNKDLYSFGSIGIRSSGRAASLNFALDNKWQLKYLRGGNEKRLNELFSMSSNASASLYKKTHPLSTINHKFYFRPGNLTLGSLPLNKGQFRWGETSLVYGSQFSVQQNPYMVHWQDFNLTNQYFSQSLAISGSAPYQSYFSAPKNQMFDSFADSDTLGTVSNVVSEASNRNAWSLSLTHDLYAPKDIFQAQSSNLRMGLTCKITENWGLSYSNYYNLKTKNMLSQSFSLSRNLHCWKMDISISRRNEYWDYRIVLFNTMLPDALRLQTRDSKKY